MRKRENEDAIVRCHLVVLKDHLPTSHRKRQNAVVALCLEPTGHIIPEKQNTSNTPVIISSKGSPDLFLQKRITTHHSGILGERVNWDAVHLK